MNKSPTVRSSLRFTRRFAKIQTHSPENTPSKIRKNSINNSDTSSNTAETPSPLHVKMNDNNYFTPSPPPGPVVPRKEKDLILPEKSASPSRFLPELTPIEKKPKPSFITSSSSSSFEGTLPRLTRKSLTIDDKLPASKVISPYSSKKMIFGDGVSLPNSSEECSHSLAAEYRSRIAKNALLLEHKIKRELLMEYKLDYKLALLQASSEQKMVIAEKHDEIPTIILSEHPGTFVDPIHPTLHLSEEEIESTVEFMQHLIKYRFGSTNTEYGCCISDLKREVSTFLVSKDYLSLVSSPTKSPSPSDHNDGVEDFAGTMKQPLHKKSPRRVIPSRSPPATESDMILDTIQAITLPIDNYQYTQEDYRNDEQLLQDFISATKKGLFYESLRVRMNIQKNMKRREFLEKALMLVHEAQKI